MRPSTPNCCPVCPAGPAGAARDERWHRAVLIAAAGAEMRRRTVLPTAVGAEGRRVTSGMRAAGWVVAAPTWIRPPFPRSQYGDIITFPSPELTVRRSSLPGFLLPNRRDKAVFYHIRRLGKILQDAGCAIHVTRFAPGKTGSITRKKNYSQMRISPKTCLSLFKDCN